MHHPTIEETYRLFHKGMGYIADNHIYKFKDYSECIFDTQIQSKWWLVESLVKPENRDCNIRHISVLASWYGIVLIPMLVNRLGSDIKIDLYDVDEYTADIARYIYQDDYHQVTMHHKDVVFDDLNLKGNVIINCSCEHMMDMSHITEQYPDALYCLQSNNNKNVKWLHINCVEDTGALAKQAGLKKVLYGESKEFYSAKTIMVIGRRQNRNEVSQNEASN